MIDHLIKQGKKAIKTGDIYSAKSISTYLGAYLDIYVPTKEEWKRIDLFFSQVVGLNEAQNSSPENLKGGKSLRSLGRKGLPDTLEALT